MKSIKEQLVESLERLEEENELFGLPYDESTSSLFKMFISLAIDRVLEEEQNRIYAYVEEQLLGEDNELLKDLSNIIFNKTN